MTRDAALAFVRDYAQTTAAPVLTDAEVGRIVDSCRIVDSEGRRITDAGYVPTYWGTRAVVLALDLKLAKAAPKTDLTADGASILASQRTANLQALRASWRARMHAGSE